MKSTENLIKTAKPLLYSDAEKIMVATGFKSGNRPPYTQSKVLLAPFGKLKT
ncbi:MAG: hypothetical protein WBA83_10140 [Burkholderiaceae bacterium]